MGKRWDMNKEAVTIDNTVKGSIKMRKKPERYHRDQGGLFVVVLVLFKMRAKGQF